LFVSDHCHVGCEGALFFVERGELLAFCCQTDDEFTALDFRCVKCVQRLAGFVEHVVGNIFGQGLGRLLRERHKYILANSETSVTIAMAEKALEFL
jgi:hypothetical protein